jgi:hypothetical protein
MRRSPPTLAARRCRAVAAAALAAAALVGGAFGCLTALGPDIRREAHHVRMSQTATRGACMTCHEGEAHMGARMKQMTPAEMRVHMQYITAVVHPPLVQDWMLRERRGCVACHRVKEPRG